MTPPGEPDDGPPDAGAVGELSAAVRVMAGAAAGQGAITPVPQLMHDRFRVETRTHGTPASAAMRRNAESHPWPTGPRTRFLGSRASQAPRRSPPDRRMPWLALPRKRPVSLRHARTDRGPSRPTGASAEARHNPSGLYRPSPAGPVPPSVEGGLVPPPRAHRPGPV